MSKPRTFAKGLVISVPLIAVTVFCSGLAINTYKTGNNTFPSEKSEEPVAVLDTPSTEEAGVIKVAVPTKVRVMSPEGATRMDNAMNALTPDDAHLYRTIFMAQEEEAWDRADKAIASLDDRRLMGVVLADRYQRRGATPDELRQWMATYADLPEADDMHALARRAKVEVPAPKAATPWPAGYTEDSAPDFRAELRDGQSDDPRSASLARSISRALRRSDPETARDLFIKAQADKRLAGTFAAEAEAAIGAAFYYDGEREQAMALADAAAVAQQPLGLWIRGLIAWERKDSKLAAASFTKLADHPSLTPAARGAAAFWAYRALTAEGRGSEAKERLAQSARQTRSFYGILASQLLGRDPAHKAGNKESLPAWDREQRAILAAHPAGWRAMALIQVNETERAEAELRRLSPHGKGDLQQAMMALAGFVPMPRLVLHLASLTGSGETEAFDSVAYPLLPWMPSQGYQIDRALVFALVRHESQFDPRAVSSQGARGLMQIMPATARGIAGIRAENASLRLDDRLFDPAFNLTLGQRYVRHLAEQDGIGNNLLLILASYNAGPNKVMRWREEASYRLDAKLADDPLLFMESIPARETRGYIARVMTHYWGYQARLGKAPSSLAALAQGHWPRITLTEPAPYREASL